MCTVSILPTEYLEMDVTDENCRVKSLMIRRRTADSLQTFSNYRLTNTHMEMWVGSITLLTSNP